VLFDSHGQPMSPAPEPSRLVKVTRSFTRKVNLGNYESADFFCSQTAECEPESVDETSGLIHEWCVDEVMNKAIPDFMARWNRKQGRAA
jgi:hypothetical protein